MKRTLMLVLASLSLTAKSADWDLVWTDPNPAGSIKNFVLTHIVNGVSTNVHELATSTLRLNLIPGNHLFSLVAIGTNNVPSDPAELTWLVPKAPIDLKLQITVTIQTDQTK